MAKNVSMAEEYLQDHFPGFPVLPGVLMLQAAIESAAWLVREIEDFAHSLVVLKQVRQARYGTFVAPGRTLIMRADLLDRRPEQSTFKVRGAVDGSTALQARISLAHLNLATTQPELAQLDRSIIAGLRSQWNQWQTDLPAVALPPVAAQTGA